MVGVCTLVLIINPFETVLLLQDYFLASIINSHLSHASQLSMCRLFKGRKGNDAQNSSFLIKLKCGMDFSSLFFLDVFSLFFLRGGGGGASEKQFCFFGAVPTDWCDQHMSMLFFLFHSYRRFHILVTHSIYT